MPKEGLSIYFTITDKASPVLASIGDQTKALDKETQQLAQSYAALKKANSELTSKQTELQKALKEAKTATKEAKKAFEEMGTAASQDAYVKAKEHQEELRQQISQTSKALRENEQIYKQNMETVRKSAVGGGSSGDASVLSIAKGLAAGQIGQMMAGSLGGIAESYLSSAIGVPAASITTNALSNAISGATAGAIAGPIGSLVGGVAGLISGVVAGNAQIFEAKDDSFKDYYVGLYDDVSAGTEDMVSSGSITAGSREQVRRAFAKRLGGTAAADRYLDQVAAMAGMTNYNYDEITGYSQLLLNSYAPSEVFGVLQRLSDATAGLNLSSGDVETMISGLSRMRTTGKATTEYLNYFTERGVDAYSALSEALGVDKGGIAEMISGGEIGGEFAAEAILDFIDKEYGGLSADMMTTYDAMSANLEDIMSTLGAAGGEGYNEMRKSGLAAETEAYSGALGEAVAEMNRISGENRAYLENLSGQYQMEALSAVLLGEGTSLFNDEDRAALEGLREEYIAAQEAYETGDQEAGLKMESLREQAEALATDAYNNSEQMAFLRETELDQIAAIRENTDKLGAATAAYELAQEKSIGMGYVIFAGTGGTPENVAGYDWDYINSLGDYAIAGMKGHAYGLGRVPYDGYPALLHAGERVLTAGQARAMDRGGGGINITISGNSFVGTSEELVDQVAEGVVRKIEMAAALAVPR